MNVTSNDNIILGSGSIHRLIFGMAAAIRPNPAADPKCLHHVFPDPGFTGGSKSANSASRSRRHCGAGEMECLARRTGGSCGWGGRAFATGDAINYLGSGAYGVKPFAIFSYRARISPHALVGFEWNTKSITAGDLSTGTKASVPNDFVYSAGADAWITKWLTGSFDIIGQHILVDQHDHRRSDLWYSKAVSRTPAISCQLRRLHGKSGSANRDHNNLQLSATAGPTTSPMPPWASRFVPWARFRNWWSRPTCWCGWMRVV